MRIILVGPVKGNVMYIIQEPSGANATEARK